MGGSQRLALRSLDPGGDRLHGADATRVHRGGQGSQVLRQPLRQGSTPDDFRGLPGLSGGVGRGNHPSGVRDAAAGLQDRKGMGLGADDCHAFGDDPGNCARGPRLSPAGNLDSPRAPARGSDGPCRHLLAGGCSPVFWLLGLLRGLS